MHGSFQELNFGEDLSRFVFHTRSLRQVVFFRIFAGSILEIQVAKIFVNCIFTLTQKFQACLLCLLIRFGLRIENLHEDAD